MESTSKTPAADSQDIKPTGIVGAVSVTSRIPDFWTDYPRVWFARAEAILAPQKLGDAVNFDLILSKLNKETIGEITDIILDPPETQKCAALKNRLLTIYEDTANLKIKKLLRDMDLGDQKPSQLLRKMKDLAKKNFPDDTVRILWEEHLPSQVRAVLAVSKSTDLEELAAVADNVLEATRPLQLATVTQRQFERIENADIAMIKAEIAKLNTKIVQLQQRRRGNSSVQRSHSQTRQRSFSNNRDKQNWLCFYHYKYHEKAHKCIKPCAWKGPSTSTPASSEN